MPVYPDAFPHQPSCRRPGANPRSWTEISLGARAHTTTIDSAIAAPVKRSALGPPGRPAGDRSPRPALNRKDVEV
jgi:hypothetical protein